MATLEDAAEELAGKLRELGHEIDEGQDALASFGGSLDGDVKRIEGEWKTLGERVNQFLQRVNEQAGRLQGDVAEGGQALAELQNGITADRAEAEQAVSASASATAELAQHVLGQQEPVQEMTAAQVEAPLQDLRQRAEDAGAALDEAVASARDFLERELPAALAAAAQQIRAAVQEACEGPLKDSATRLQQGYDEWETMLSTIEGAVLGCSFAAAPGNAREFIDYALRECRTGSDQALEQVRDLAGLVEQALQDLQEDVAARTATQRQEAQEELSNGHRDLLQALADSGRALDAVKGLLASFTFVRL